MVLSHGTVIEVNVRLIRCRNPAPWPKGRDHCFFDRATDQSRLSVARTPFVALDGFRVPSNSVVCREGDPNVLKTNKFV